MVEGGTEGGVTGKGRFLTRMSWSRGWSSTMSGVLMMGETG